MSEIVNIRHRYIAIVRAIFAWLLLIIGCYFAAALLGSFIGRNYDWREPDRGVEIFVETNGVHTAIVLPRAYGDHDWADFLPADDLVNPSKLGLYLSFSWGERNFFLETESWSDLKPSIAAKAIFGSDQTLMHVYHYPKPTENEYYRSVKISDDQHKALIKIIKAKFTRTDTQKPQPITGYGETDIFYPSSGYYSPLNTCNIWTNETLHSIGINVGIWTPMAGGVMRWFPKSSDVSDP